MPTFPDEPATAGQARQDVGETEEPHRLAVPPGKKNNERIPTLTDVEATETDIETPSVERPALRAPSPMNSFPKLGVPPTSSAPDQTLKSKPDQQNELTSGTLEMDPPVLRPTEEALAGLKGYCLVTLKTERKLVKGRDEFRSVYQGHIYRFVSAQAQEQFANDPARFAPALKGNDAVILASGEKASPGNLDHAVWFKGKLYMFTSETTLNTFRASPARFTTAK
jgi:YHS domain-containing protein